ncbi:hypothetical protein BZA70DRAFT_177765 [Myxozyma melibiosi]|uniref:Uncharacterized protein n=1 Tax=Myxozyma melibiosi TaxID=54550 RepID=A0ABR1F859_9ASCO
MTSLFFYLLLRHYLETYLVLVRFAIFTLMISNQEQTPTFIIIRIYFVLTALAILILMILIKKDSYIHHHHHHHHLDSYWIAHPPSLQAYIDIIIIIIIKAQLLHIDSKLKMIIII